MAKSTRDRDYKVQAVIDEFMDRYAYSNDKLFSNIRRCSDTENQLAGIDLFATILNPNLGEVAIDEKAQSQYLLNPKDSFVLELNARSLESGYYYEGWFTDPHKKTEYYVIEWCKAKKEDNITIDDIIQVEYILISRNKLKEYFEKAGYDRAELIKACWDIRQRKLSKSVGYSQDIPWCFYHSSWIPEQPINIVVRKSLLIELADIHQIVKPDPFIDIFADLFK